MRRSILHCLPSPANPALLLVLAVVVLPAHAQDKSITHVSIRLPSSTQAIDMIAIPAGTFTTSPDTRPLCGSNGLPSRSVEVEAFWLASTEVTFDLWDRCVAQGGCKHNPETPGWGRGQHPVSDIGWDHAKEFATWLSRETGKSFRLPTADEWEYAARSGLALEQVPTAASDPRRVNFKEDSLRPSGEKTHANLETTVPVGSLPANEWGLYEMAGNLWEWTSDCGCDHGYETSSPGPRQMGCDSRMLRGGSYTTDADSVSPVSRFQIWPWFHAAYTGFRVAMD